jgi:hypothetical protein
LVPAAWATRLHGFSLTAEHGNVCSTTCCTPPKWSTVYDLSALPESRTRQEIRRRAGREFEALGKHRDTQDTVRVAESFQPVEGYGGERHYFALSLSAGPCLASRVSESSWSFESRFAAAKRLCKIMPAVHQVGAFTGTWARRVSTSGASSWTSNFWVLSSRVFPRRHFRFHLNFMLVLTRYPRSRSRFTMRARHRILSR